MNKEELPRHGKTWAGSLKCELLKSNQCPLVAYKYPIVHVTKREKEREREREIKFLHRLIVYLSALVSCIV